MKNFKVEKHLGQVFVNFAYMEPFSSERARVSAEGLHFSAFHYLGGSNEGKRCNWKFCEIPPLKVTHGFLSQCCPLYTASIIYTLLMIHARRPVYTYEISGRYDIGGLESYLHCCSNYRPPSNQSQTL
jgi:hypothetical protein